MCTVRLILDSRASTGDAPVKIYISYRRKVTLISTGVKCNPLDWDADAGKVKAGLTKDATNESLSRMLDEARAKVSGLQISGKLETMSPGDIREALTGKPQKSVKKKLGTFVDTFTRFADLHEGRTREMYHFTLSRLRSYCPDVDKLDFEAINVEWLRGFDTWFASRGCAVNYRSIQLRNVRAVFNFALDEEITQFYPFRRFKIRSERTRKRALSVENLRLLASYPCEAYQVYYRDMFLLIFALIGINCADLFNLDEVSPSGRIDYTRAKTHRPYSIKIEPEAAAIIDKYRGARKLINAADRWTDHTQFLKQTNNALKKIGELDRVGLGGKKIRKPLFPDLTTYWARHTWATIAASLDIPKETIAAALGHGGNTVTDIYIDFDQKKVDEANRKVLDYVFKGV